MRVLLLPDWCNAGPTHWLSRWEALHGYARVPQHDWERPLRGDWLIQLEESVLRHSGPVAVVAHGLGVDLLAAWAAHTRHAGRVAAGLLVAPRDTARPDARVRLPGWWPLERRRLPFRSLLLASRSDPSCSYDTACGLAQNWGATLVDAGAAGGLDAGLGDWPWGHALLERLLTAPQGRAAA